MHWHIYTHTGTHILRKFYATYINRSSGSRGGGTQNKKPQKFNLCYVSNCICIIHISIHKSVSCTHYLYRMCKSPTPLRKQIAKPYHLTCWFLQKGSFTVGNPSLWIKTVKISIILVSMGWCHFANLCTSLTRIIHVYPLQNIFPSSYPTQNLEFHLPFTVSSFVGPH